MHAQYCIHACLQRPDSKSASFRARGSCDARLCSLKFSHCQLVSSLHFVVLSSSFTTPFTDQTYGLSTRIVPSDIPVIHDRAYVYRGRVVASASTPHRLLTPTIPRVSNTLRHPPVSHVYSRSNTENPPIYTVCRLVTHAALLSFTLIVQIAY